MKGRAVTGIILVILLVNSLSLFAQNQSVIREIAKQYQSGEISLQEAKNRAEEAGASQNQIQQGIQQARQRQMLDQPQSEVTRDTITRVVREKMQQEEVAETAEDLDKKQDTIREKDTAKTYFGYDIFRGPSGKYDALAIGTPDPDYLIGPGDELIISLWGQIEMRYSLTVSRSGTIFINDYGQIVVSGNTLQQLEKKLTRNLSKVYSSLKPESGNPTTFLDISLGKLRQYTVFVTGYVKNPGAHQVSSYATAFNALYKSGGPKTSGSLRSIRVIRNNKTVTTLDLYDFITSGKKPNDVRLQHNDIIYVPPRLSTIEVNGAIRDTAIYEMKPEEDLQELVSYAGGLLPETDIERVLIERTKAFEKREEQKSSRTVINKKLGVKTPDGISINTIDLQDGDIVTFYDITDEREDYVTVKGAVKRPGRYAFEERMMVADLIQQAGGLQKFAYTKQAILTRTYKDKKTRSFNFGLDSATMHSFQLKDWDELRVYSIWDFLVKDSVKISGHVKNPGTYAFHDSLMVSDLIMRGGGLEDEFFWSQTYQKRADIFRYTGEASKRKLVPVKLDSLLLDKEKYDMPLQPRDSIRIYPASVNHFPDIVTVSGRVKQPGQYVFTENSGIHDLILQAGGFTRNAYHYLVEVYRLDQENEDSLAIEHQVKLQPNMLDTFDTETGFDIEPLDLIVVRKDPAYEPHRTVQLSGEVKFPGTYPILKKGETFCSLIDRAGGITDEAFIEGIRYYRNDSISVVGDFSKFIDASDCALELASGDSIYIPSHPQTVEVTGAVNSPGLVQYKENWKVNDYIEAAGDYSLNAFERKTIIYFPGGNAKRKNWLFKRRIQEGSRIFVPLEPEKEPIDWTSLLAQWASIASSVATTIYIINR